MAKPSLLERIDAALADGPMSYGDLARALWPDGKAWSYSRNGGPPGCYMALSAGIGRGKFPLGIPRNGSNASRLVYPRAKTSAAPPVALPGNHEITTGQPAKNLKEEP